jgi:hypothetical protein
MPTVFTDLYDTAAHVKPPVFGDMTQCGWVSVRRCFEGSVHLRLQGQSVPLKGNRDLANVTNYSPSDSVSCLTQIKSEAAPLQKTEVPQSCI